MEVVIIYNPKSIGASEERAQRLMRQILKHAPDFKVTCLQSEYPTHATEIAKTYASSGKPVLLISVSGDGGYHEVINGIMQSGENQAIAAVLASGNANDHSRVMHKAPLIRLIKKRKFTKIDLLKITIVSAKGRTEVHYAHSYAGLGLTPAGAKIINELKPGLAKQGLLAGQLFMKLKPTTIKRRGRLMIFDSLVFANINEIAKFFKITTKAKPNDGYFGVVNFPHETKAALLKRIVKAGTVGLKTAPHYQKYVFETVATTDMQLDGEVIELKKDAVVTVESAHRVLRTLASIRG